MCVCVHVCLWVCMLVGVCGWVGICACEKDRDFAAFLFYFLNNCSYVILLLLPFSVLFLYLFFFSGFLLTVWMMTLTWTSC